MVSEREVPGRTTSSVAPNNCIHGANGRPDIDGAYCRLAFIAADPAPQVNRWKLSVHRSCNDKRASGPIRIAETITIRARVRKSTLRNSTNRGRSK